MGGPRRHYTVGNRRTAPAALGNVQARCGVISAWRRTGAGIPCRHITIGDRRTTLVDRIRPRHRPRIFQQTTTTVHTRRVRSSVVGTTSRAVRRRCLCRGIPRLDHVLVTRRVVADDVVPRRRTIRWRRRTQPVRTQHCARGRCIALKPRPIPRTTTRRGHRTRRGNGYPSVHTGQTVRGAGFFVESLREAGLLVVLRPGIRLQVLGRFRIRVRAGGLLLLGGGVPGSTLRSQLAPQRQARDVPDARAHRLRHPGGEGERIPLRPLTTQRPIPGLAEHLGQALFQRFA